MSEHKTQETMPADVRGAVSLDQNAAATSSAGGSTTPGATASSTDQNQLTGPIIRDVSEADLNEIAVISQQVPVVIDLWATWCQPCKQLGPILEDLTRELDGRIVLAKVDVDANPQLAQAFQAQSIPTVVALVGGRPVPLFQGAQPRQQVAAVFNELLQVATQAGVTGRMVDTAAPAEPKTDPLHEAALAAEDAGDIERAIGEWETVLKKQPKDHTAKEALARLNLAKRVTSEEHDSSPLGRADQAFINDQVDDAFSILLDTISEQKLSEPDAAEAARTRLIEMFTVLGNSDPRVKAARARLSTLLF
ncbi:MAG: tetratricopeptide repeat protein [Actinomycetaceae bacterium]|nr:tetratricopeptide repeat protein [Actinomycetaceae bacterium]